MNTSINNVFGLQHTSIEYIWMIVTDDLSYMTLFIDVAPDICVGGRLSKS
jgi:hypothetical protein